MLRLFTKLPRTKHLSRTTHKMSTFNLPDWKHECPVHLTNDISKDQLLSFPAFKNWLGTLRHSLEQQQDQSHTFHEAPYVLRRIDVQSVDFFGKNKERIGFIKLTAEVTNDENEYLPASVFLRGGSVAMLVRLRRIFPHQTPSFSHYQRSAGKHG